MNTYGSFLNTYVTAAVFRQIESSSFHLSFTGFTPQLRIDLID